MSRNRFIEPAPGPPDDPARVLARDDLTHEGKIALLRNWQLDLTERMTATDENMSGPHAEGQLAEQHRSVSEALSTLEPHDDPAH